MILGHLWMEYAAAACIGFLLDFIVGDPHGLCIRSAGSES